MFGFFKKRPVEPVVLEDPILVLWREYAAAQKPRIDLMNAAVRHMRELLARNSTETV